jgi:hypothetical protein
MKQRAKQDDKTCLINSEGGHLWMVNHFDPLPVAVRRRLRISPFNLCSACLVTLVLRNVQARHPNWPRERLLFAAIEEMEAAVRK